MSSSAAEAPFPPQLERQQRLARIANLTAPVILERIRGTCEGPMVLLKGAEVAARYPGRARVFGDIDLLVPDAGRTQTQLLAAGFEVQDSEVGWFGTRHLDRLRWPDTPLAVEIHSTPNWPDALRPPSAEELFEAAVPSRCGVSGILAPSAAHHTLLLAAHAWAHQPLGRLRDLVDVAAFRSEVDARELGTLARRWGIVRLWRTTSRSVDAVLAGESSWPLRLWARHVADIRRQTVLEAHLERFLAPFWGYPAGIAGRVVATAVANETRPALDEGWREKLGRSVSAVRRWRSPVDEHRRILGDAARRVRHRHGPALDESREASGNPSEANRTSS